MRQRLKGFTLIELLVVIAIIAILAAMLFPVFARARESARKIQCLSNVKNIATAVQMYLVDYDRFPPKEHDPAARAAVMEYGANVEGGDCYGGSCSDGHADCRATEANPYLRWPVILEEYVRNRDVWRCPSAKFVAHPGINWGYGVGQWWQYLLDVGDVCHRPRPCSDPFPPGWGGSITDSAKQDQCAGPEVGGFEQSIGYPRTLYDMKTGQMSDPAKHVVAADAGPAMNALDRTSWVAYPDFCRIDGVACTSQGWQCGSCYPIADSGCCVDSDGDPCAPAKGEVQFALDPTYRKQHARPRHLGGSNLGFADGHASWMASETILFGGENWSGWASNPDNPLLLGLGVCIVPSTECCGRR